MKSEEEEKEAIVSAVVAVVVISGGGKIRKLVFSDEATVHMSGIMN
jgi:hypothetical protein